MRVLAVSTHPDDETLGCGGTLLKHCAVGDSLNWLIVTETSEPRWSETEIERKADEVNRVAEAYGMEWCHKLGFPAIGLDTIPISDLIHHIGNVIKETKPELVYVVHAGDVHTDHQIVFTATMSVLKPFYMAALGVRRVLCYETLSSTEAAPPQHARAFIPNVFNDVTGFMDRKIGIMGLYQTEAQEDPMPRGSSAIRALGRYRGATIGVEHAEAFTLIRELI